MNVHFTGQHNLFNVSRANQSISNKSGNNPQRTDGMQGMRNDTVSISPRGKVLSFIDNLMKQKEQINERKNELIGTTLEQGADMASIETQLEHYEEQLTSIDEQISSAMSKEMEKDEPKSQQKPEPTSKEGVMNNRLSDIVNSSSDINKMEVAHAVKKKVDGEVRILKSQVKTDQGATKESKLEKISKVEHISSNISSQIGEQIATANEKIDTSTSVEKIAAKENIDANGDDSVPEEMNTTSKI